MWHAREVDSLWKNLHYESSSSFICAVMFSNTINQFPLSFAVTLLTASMDFHKGRTWAFKDFMMDSIDYRVKGVYMWGPKACAGAVGDIETWSPCSQKNTRAFLTRRLMAQLSPTLRGEQCLSNRLKASVQSQLVVLLLIPIRKKAGNNYCYFWKGSFNAKNSCRGSWREPATFKLYYHVPIHLHNYAAKVS